MFEEPHTVIYGVAHDNRILDALEHITKRNNFRIQADPPVLHPANEWNLVHVNVQLEEDITACFDIQQMPGCCAVLVLSYIRVDPFTQENFDRVVQLVEQAAKMAAFGSVIMTQVIPERGAITKEPWYLCSKRDWFASPAFRNAKSGNLVVYLTKNLQQEGKMKGFEVLIKKSGAKAEL